MKLRKPIQAILITMGLSISAYGISVFAQAGSSSDPLVSKSYVDSKVNEVVKLVQSSGTVSSSNTSISEEEIINEVMRRMGATVQSGNLALPENNSTSVNASYKTIQITKGQVLIGQEGTEIVVRSGECQTYSTVSNGLADVTQGTELLNGRNIQRNHMLLVPKGDGRGIRVLSDSWVMVKGGYNIIK